MIHKFSEKPPADPKCTARVLMRTNRRVHISPVVASHHWLPVKFRIEFSYDIMYIWHYCCHQLVFLCLSRYPLNGVVLVVPSLLSSQIPAGGGG